jgi:hypothetical protein
MSIPDKKDSKNLPSGKLEDWLQMPSDGDSSPGGGMLDELPGETAPESAAPEPESQDSPEEPAGDGEPAPDTVETIPDQPETVPESLDSTELPDDTGLPLEAEPPETETLPLFDVVDQESKPTAEEEPDVVGDGTAVTSFADVLQKASDVTDSDESAVEDLKTFEAEVEELEEKLAEEFRDTLTGGNALTLPIGVLLVVLAAFGWFLGPITGAIGMGNIIGYNRLIITFVAALFTLAGIHLVFYWGIHRISNVFKSRQLDRLIEQRRELRVCRHLDCDEEDIPVDLLDDVEGSEIRLGDDRGLSNTVLVWKCNLYGIDLEEYPVCAVCERYDPVMGPDVVPGHGTSDVQELL